LRSAAFFPHLLDVTQGRELLSGNHLNRESTAQSFAAQTGNRHPAEREGVLKSILQPQRGIWPRLHSVTRGLLAERHQTDVSA
jgi:hypothetical protein